MDRERNTCSAGSAWKTSLALHQLFSYARSYSSYGNPLLKDKLLHTELGLGSAVYLDLVGMMFHNIIILIYAQGVRKLHQKAGCQARFSL